jgi:PAS domain S-box-containing protein
MSSDQMRVLLVEDDPDDILLVKDALAEVSLGKIRLEYTGRLSRGLIELSSHPYDVVLLDLNLPDSRGLETLKTVIKSYPKVPVVVLSGLADDVTTTEAVRRGAQDYLVKGDLNGPMLMRVLRYAIERKQAEAVLRESEARYRALVETTPNGISLTDLDGNLVLCNQQTAVLHGYDSPDELIGKNVYELVAPADRQQAGQNTQKILSEGRVMSAEYTLVRKDGSGSGHWKRRSVS